MVNFTLEKFDKQISIRYVEIMSKKKGDTPMKQQSDSIPTSELPQQIPLSKIHDLPGSLSPKPKDHELTDLIRSIQSDGIITPISVRQSESGEYQIISGNRRRRACEILNINEIPAYVCNMTLSEALKQAMYSNTAMPAVESQSPSKDETLLDRMARIVKTKRGVKTKQRERKRKFYRG